MKKSLVAVIAGLALSVGLATGLFASTAAQEITALLDPTLNIVYNNTPLTVADAAGNQLYPINYNGTTYVPAKMVAQVLNLTTSYEDATKTVYIGPKEGGEVDLTSLPTSFLPGKYRDDGVVIRDSSLLTVQGESGAATYKSGIYLHRDSSWGKIDYHNTPFFDVSNKSEVTFTMWADKKATVHLINSEGDTITSYDVAPNSLLTQTVNIAGIPKVGFIFEVAYGAKGLSEVKILDPTVK